MGISAHDGQFSGRPRYSSTSRPAARCTWVSDAPSPTAPTREEDVLNGGEEGLELRRSSARPAGDDEVHGRLVQMIGEVDRRAHVAPLRCRIGEILRRLERRPDVLLEQRAVAIGDPSPALGVGDRDEDPRLAVAAARGKRTGLAHLADQGGRNRVRPQPPQRAAGRMPSRSATSSPMVTSGASSSPAPRGSSWLTPAR